MGEKFVGFILLLLLIARAASAQVAGGVAGEVEMIGFENYYRSTAWTPMIVRLSSTAKESADYQLRVYQEDLDRDRPIFTRTISVTGATEEGAARDQRFRMYFKASPTDGGLPDATAPESSIAGLQKKLSVQLWSSASTPKFITELPLTSTVFDVDHNGPRGTKFVLAVFAGGSRPAHREYDGSTIGLLEDVSMVTIKTDQLPENPIAYDGIDAILWLDADPADLSTGGDEKLRALQQYVRGGGHLVISQQSDAWQKSLGFGDLLPVTIAGVQTLADAGPLKTLARPHRSFAETDTSFDPWASLGGPTTLGVAQVKADGIVDTWIDWPDRPPSAYLARCTYGCGCVSWVAQDLGDVRLTRAVESNWPVVWNRIFDWKDNPMNVDRVSKDAIEEYADSSKLSAADSLFGQTDLAGKGFGLTALALVAFVIYWLVAGPGSYFYLVAKNRTGASWFVFAATAIVFAGLSVVLVRLVLHGPSELKHLSVARHAGDDAFHVHSRFGLYIPNDGNQSLSLPDAAPGTTSSLTAYAIPWQLMANDDSNDVGQPYTVPIPDASGSGVTSLTIPFRSTLKKFEADWSGQLNTSAGSLTLGGGIEGHARLNESVGVDGHLTNATGQTLHDVYVAYKWKARGNEDDQRNDDYLVYLPQWPAGATMDLNQELTKDDSTESHHVPFVDPGGVTPFHGHKCRGRLETDWCNYWFRTSDIAVNQTMDFHDSLIVLSLFSRIRPDRRTVEHKNEFTLTRIGAHRYDVSPALAAGAMVIIAHVDSPDTDGPPMPLQVNGRLLRGTGTTLCQFVVPVDNSVTLPEPTNAPSTSATTQPIAP